MPRKNLAKVKSDAAPPDVRRIETTMDLPVVAPEISPDNLPRKVGLIAGWGDFPIVVAKALKDAGVEVYCVMLHGHADPELAQHCTRIQWLGVTKLGGKIRFFRRHGVQHVTMAGKLFKTLMFQKFAWLRHLPDLHFLRYFYNHFLTNRAGRNDDELMLTIIKAFNDSGIEMAAATDYAPSLLIGNGVLTHQEINEYQWQDITFGWQMAKEMGRLDVGQTVIVHSRAVIAVEAVEGTDACIERAGQLCPVGGFTVVKVAKPQQDMRFDVPTIGIQTLENIRAAGGRILAIEAEKTIVLNQDQVIQYANDHQISIIALDQDQISARNAA